MRVESPQKPAAMMVIKGHLGSTSSGGPRQLKPQPIKSWTAKSEKVYEKSRENGFVPAQRGLYTKTKNPLPVKYTVRGEWELQECEVRYGFTCGFNKKS